MQYTIVESLIRKLKKAAKDLSIQHIGIAGGVSANSGLRSAVVNLGVENNWQTFIPAFQYCTDNAAMIAITAHYKYLAQQFVNLDAVPTARAFWSDGEK